MSGLVTGLQNRARRFESARHLKGRDKCKSVCLFFFFTSQLLILPAGVFSHNVLCS